MPPRLRQHPARQAAINPPTHPTARGTTETRGYAEPQPMQMQQQQRPELMLQQCGSTPTRKSHTPYKDGNEHYA